MRPRSSAHSAISFLAALAFFAAPATAAAQQPDGLAIIERAAERYRGAEAICADFVQTLEVVLLGSSKTGVGRLCQARPDRFAMRFTDPAGDLVVVDGESVWLYTPSDDSKVAFRVASEGGGGYDLHREFLEAPATKYEIVYEARDEVDGHATHRLTLTPLARGTRYVQTRLWIDTGTPLLRRIRIEEENGTVRTVTLSGIDLAPRGVDPAFFTFTPPPGVDVISR